MKTNEQQVDKMMDINIAEVEASQLEQHKLMTKKDFDLHNNSLLMN